MADHEFLTRGGAFTPPFIENYVTFKRMSEVDPIAMRPHRYEFQMYYDFWQAAARMTCRAVGAPVLHCFILPAALQVGGHSGSVTSARCTPPTHPDTAGFAHPLTPKSLPDGCHKRACA